MNLWDSKSHIYQFLRKYSPLSFLYYREVASLKRLCELKPLTAPLLDIGTGAGTIAELTSCSPIIALDSSEKMLLRAKAVSAQLKPLLAVASSLPVRSGMCKSVSAIGIEEYLHNKDRFWKEILRISDGDATLLLTIAHSGFFNNLRRLLGAKLYLSSTSEWKSRIEDSGCIIVGMRKTLLQTQFLITVPEQATYHSSL